MKSTVRFKVLGAAALVCGAVAASLVATDAGAATVSAAQRIAPARASDAHKPTVVLLHGAFADSSSWNSEISYLRRHDYPVYAIDTPLRGVAYDSAYVEAQLKTIDGPVVLVGHSYAGEVISQVAAETPNVKALVYVAALIPQVGDSANSLIGQFPGSELTPENLRTVPLPDGATDVYIKADKFGTAYGNGLPKAGIRTASVTQEPIAFSALTDKATVNPPKGTPKWAVIATDDHAVPTRAQKFEADRAGARISYVRSGHDVPAIAPHAVNRAIVAAADSLR
ncbi:Pimeloyl-ACP methyl ester carboxylesterase [Actinacidiphila alni]|uniref:Pimeloyl-ACP methyl ester carboxylesterase n=1 Tax=Actinacidiphila alni TaxID=380248 RepID=A0A1I2ISG8_9ACTN|nr:alpha/beta fold hydrolase [Actinacidiphila alni]SFF45372.1 Pimeloyl-ACP methyl ester carboxylesterase [Actinacidiphila alni]